MFLFIVIMVLEWRPKILRYTKVPVNTMVPEWHPTKL
jgi:hypothetical protein